MAAGLPLPSAADIAWATWADDSANAVDDGFVKDETIATATGTMTTAATFATSTTFTLTGDQTAVYVAGRRLRIAHTGGTSYCRVKQSSFSGGTTTVTIANISSGPQTMTTPISSCAFALDFGGAAGNGINIGEQIMHTAWGL